MLQKCTQAAIISELITVNVSNKLEFYLWFFLAINGVRASWLLDFLENLRTHKDGRKNPLRQLMRAQLNLRTLSTVLLAFLS